MSKGLAGLHIVRTPDRPGPGPMPDALLRALDFTIGRRVAGLLAGDYPSPALGVGTELAQVRPYEWGDDVRTIDWNVTARTNEVHVRAHVAERMLTTWLVLDTSPSMTFGTADRRKADVAEGVALAVGHIATRRGNRLGLVAFGQGDPVVLPPRQGRAGVIGLLRTLRERDGVTADEPPSRSVSLAEALRRLTVVGGRGKLVVIASDFRGPRDWQRELLELAGRHSVVAAEIRDPREQELPDVGEVWFVDPESGRQLRVNTSDRRMRERFREAAEAERRELAGQFQRCGVRHVVLSTAGDWLRELAGFLKSNGAAR